MSERTTALGHDRTITATGWVVAAAGAAAAALRTINGVPGERTDPRGMLATLAFGTVIAAPGIMALLARHDRPALVLPAAIILVPASFLSFAGVLLPLLVPAYLLFRTYTRHRRRDGWLDAAVAVALLALWLTSLVMLLGDTSMVEYRSTDVTHSVEMPTHRASVGSLLALAAGLSLAWWATGPDQGRRPPIAS